MENKTLASSSKSDSILVPDLVERVLEKLGFTDQPSLNLAGLNEFYAAFSGSVPNDNIQKRIWFAGDQTTAVTGGEPSEFFENWLAHGTGGTCFPINGAIYALLRATGFDARRIAGSMLMENYEQDANHGSVLVTLGSVDYLVDAQLSAFKVLPLTPNQPTSTGNGIHDIRAMPIAGGFDVFWYPGPNRQEPLVFRTVPEYDPVDHDFFLAQYDRSASREMRRSPFNDVLFIRRHFRDRILIIGHKNKIIISDDNTTTKTEITDDTERKSILVDEFNISEEIANTLPPDEPGSAAVF